MTTFFQIFLNSSFISDLTIRRYCKRRIITQKVFSSIYIIVVAVAPFLHVTEAVGEGVVLLRSQSPDSDELDIIYLELVVTESRYRRGIWDSNRAPRECCCYAIPLDWELCNWIEVVDSLGLCHVSRQSRFAGERYISGNLALRSLTQLFCGTNKLPGWQALLPRRPIQCLVVGALLWELNMDSRLRKEKCRKENY